MLQIDAGSTNDYICMYYNNSKATDAQDATNTWDSNFLGVWHLNGDFLDSTANTNHGAAAGGPTCPFSGKISGAVSFDGVDDRVVIQPFTFYGMSAFTVEYWRRFPEYKANTYFSQTMQAGKWNDAGFLLKHNGATQVTYSTFYWWSRKEGGGTGSYSFDVLPYTGYNTWAYYVSTYNNSSRAVKLYIDNVPRLSEVIPAGDTNIVDIPPEENVGFNQFVMGTCTEWYNYNMTEVIDEVRISKKVRSDTWIEAQHLSMTDAYITHGTEEARPILGTVISFQ